MKRTLDAVQIQKEALEALMVRWDDLLRADLQHLNEVLQEAGLGSIRPPAGR